MIFQLLGILSAVVFLVCALPYLIDTINHKTKPHRVTWGVSVAINIITFANQYASGADNSLWVIGAAVFLTGAIFIASLKNGVGGYSKFDIFAIATSVFGILLWVILDSPVYSILANMLVGGISTAPSIFKARRDPESETRIIWLGGLIANVLAAISVGELKWQLLILPVFFGTMNAIMVYYLYITPRREKLHR